MHSKFALDTFFIEDMHLQGVNVYLTDSHIGGNIKAGPSKTFESPVREWIEKIVGPGWNYYDIGAHVGVFAAYALKLIDHDGMVVCYEPRKDLCDILEWNLENQRSSVPYFVFQVAAMDYDGEIDLFENVGQNDGDNRVANTSGLDGADGWRKVKVRCSRLSTPHPPESPIFLKIDAQWAEMAVLRGAEGLFLDRVEAGVVEVQNEDRNDVVNFLVDHGFKYTDLGPDVGFRREGS